MSKPVINPIIKLIDMEVLVGFKNDEILPLVF